MSQEEVFIRKMVYELRFGEFCSSVIVHHQLRLAKLMQECGKNRHLSHKMTCRRWFYEGVGLGNFKCVLRTHVDIRSSVNDRLEPLLHLVNSTVAYVTKGWEDFLLKLQFWSQLVPISFGI